jgi:hypothetical protein
VIFMDGFGFDVIPEHLHTAASGIEAAVNQISDAVVHEVGGGADYGHEGLHGAVTEFLSATQGHIQGCQRDAGIGAQALRMDSGTYSGTDGRTAGVFGGR